MKVNEIFYSIEREGIRAGMPCVFIRVFGCNLNCSYCDTRYSCDGTDFTEMSVDDILSEVKKYHCKNVTVTGGEPLIHSNITQLLCALKSLYDVNVETNGSVVPFVEGITYTVDFKTNASGMSDRMNVEAFTKLDDTDVIKFVVGSIDDLQQAKEFIDTHNPKAQIFVSPVFGMIEPSVIVDFLKDNSLDTWRVQLQLHKYIWDPKKRGV